MRQELVKDTLRYFLDHPEAIDSVEGIAKWRLMEEALRRRVAEIQEALDWLTTEGYLTSTTRPGTDTLFRLNPERLRAAQEFVEDP